MEYRPRIVIGMCQIDCGLFQCLYNGIFSGDIMSKLYTCGGEVWDSLALAIEYANFVYMNQGIILGIEEIV